MDSVQQMYATNEELFPEHGGGEGINIGGRRIKCMRFADDMALLTEDERMVKNMLMELNEDVRIVGRR